MGKDWGGRYPAKESTVQRRERRKAQKERKKRARQETQGRGPPMEEGEDWTDEDDVDPDRGLEEESFSYFRYRL